MQPKIIKSATLWSKQYTEWIPAVSAVNFFIAQSFLQPCLPEISYYALFAFLYFRIIP